MNFAQMSRQTSTNPLTHGRRRHVNRHVTHRPARIVRRLDRFEIGGAIDLVRAVGDRGTCRPAWPSDRRSSLRLVVKTGSGPAEVILNNRLGFSSVAMYGVPSTTVNVPHQLLPTSAWRIVATSTGWPAQMSRR